MSVLRKYLVRVPQSVMLVFKVTAESPSAAKAIAMAGEVEDAYQEARPVSADDLPNTDNWIVEEVSD